MTEKCSLEKYFKNDDFVLRSLEGLKSKIDLAGLPAAMREFQHIRSTGTTVLALRYADGVIVAGDRRVTIGHMHNDDYIKIVPTANLTLLACAGTVSYIQDLIEVLKSSRESAELLIEAPLYVDAQAELLKNIIKVNFYYFNMMMYMLGYYAVPILAGYDPETKTGRIFGYDEQGGFYEHSEYAVSGSGGEIAETILEDYWEKNMDEQKGIELAIRAITRASRDIHTSPPALAPVTAHSVSESGIRNLPEDKALLLAWQLYLRDLKRRGKKTEYDYFLGKEKK